MELAVLRADSSSLRRTEVTPLAKSGTSYFIMMHFRKKLLAGEKVDMVLTSKESFNSFQLTFYYKIRNSEIQGRIVDYLVLGF